MWAHTHLSMYPPHLPGQAKVRYVCTHVGCVSSLIQVRCGHLHLSISMYFFFKKKKEEKKKITLGTYLHSTNPPKVCSRRPCCWWIKLNICAAYLFTVFSGATRKRKGKKKYPHHHHP